MNNEQIKEKIEWEGWPEALEWISPDECESEQVAELIDEATEHYFALERIRDELEQVLGYDEEAE